VSDLRLLLIRHGEVSNSDHVVYGDLDGFHLSPLGVRQAHETATHLRTEDIDAVICSPLAGRRRLQLLWQVITILTSLPTSD